MRLCLLAISPTRATTHEPHKDNNNQPANLDEGKPVRPQPYRQLRNTKSNIVPRRRAHQSLCQHKMVSPENIYTSNIKQTEQVVFMHLGISRYILTTRKEATGLKEIKDGL